MLTQNRVKSGDTAVLQGNLPEVFIKAGLS